MTLCPKDAVFDRFLQEVEWTFEAPNSPGEDSIELGHGPRVDMNARKSYPMARLRRRPGGQAEGPPVQITFGQGLKRTQERLQAAGHASTAAAAANVLAVFSELRLDNVPAIEQWKEWLEKTHPADLTLWAVLPVPVLPSFSEARVGPFHLHALHGDTLRSALRKAKSSLPFDPGELHGRLCIRRDRLPVHLIDWQRRSPEAFARLCTRRQDLAGTVILDDYYRAVALACHEGASEELSRLQLLREAAGLPFVHESLFASPLNGKLIGLLRWKYGAREVGWVTLIERSLGLSMPSSSGSSLVQRWLSERFQRSGDAALPSGPLESYCRFIRKAQRHAAESRNDEAFLHFVIALDLLLGGDEGLSKKVSTRAAVVAFQPLGRTFEEQRGIMKRAYGARSRYVHEGRPPGAEDLCEVEAVCREVLWALLRVHAGDPSPASSEKSDRWLARLDRLEGALRAGMPLDPEELRAAGLAVAPERHPFLDAWPDLSEA